MAMISINLNPSRREMRWFGLLVLLFFGLIGGLVLWRAQSLTVSVTLWSIGAAMCAMYYAIRPLRRPIYRGWMYAVYPIGWVISHTVLALTYYLVLTPIGLLMRGLGRDPMERRLDRSAKTYWVPYNPHGEATRYFRQF